MIQGMINPLPTTSSFDESHLSSPRLRRYRHSFHPLDSNHLSIESLQFALALLER